MPVKIIERHLDVAYRRGGGIAETRKGEGDNGRIVGRS